MAEFCSVHPLIDMNDLSKEKAILCMIDGNRGGGKTVAGKDFVLQNYIKTGRKFIWLVRFGNQIYNTSLSFMKDLQDIETDYFKQYRKYEMTDKCIVNDAICELRLNGEVCGYTIAINAADNIKRRSSMFVDCDWMLFDEFQPLNGRYIENEVEMLINIYTSVARGGGEHVRNVRILMLANSISLLNPYYYELDIAQRIQPETKYLRGNGWILYRYMNYEAADAIKTKGISKVFGADNKMVSNSAGDGYYIDDSKFIEKPESPGRPIYAIKYKDKIYGVWIHSLYYYISNKYDPAVKLKIAATLQDHDQEWRFIQYKSDINYKLLYNMYNNGYVRFQDLGCKEAFFKFLRY